MRLYFFFNHQKEFHVQKLPKAKSLGLNSFCVVLFFMSLNCNKVIIDFQTTRFKSAGIGHILRNYGFFG